MNARPLTKLMLCNRSGLVTALLCLSAATVSQTTLSQASYGQQAGVPGSTALDQEDAAPQRKYTVELIVFEYLDRSSAGTEVFEPDPVPDTYTEDPFFDQRSDDSPASQQRLDTLARGNGERLPEVADVIVSDNDDQSADTQDPETAPGDMELLEIPTHEQAGLRLLARDQYELVDVYANLQRLDAYRPVLHTAWTQPTIEKERTLAINIRRLGNPPLHLEGSVSLYLSRFLHLVVDLTLEERNRQSTLAGTSNSERRSDQPQARERSLFGFGRNRETAPAFTPSIHYEIKEDRIVKNGELRYYDHPRFGVIAKINRVEEEKPGDEARN